MDFLTDCLLPRDLKIKNNDILFDYDPSCFYGPSPEIDHPTMSIFNSLVFTEAFRAHAKTFEHLNFLKFLMSENHIYVKRF